MNRELIDFKEWCKDHTTNALYKGIGLAIDNYTKSVNSMSDCERQPVGNNEHSGNKIKNECICDEMRKQKVNSWHCSKCKITWH